MFDEGKFKNLLEKIHFNEKQSSLYFSNQYFTLLQQLVKEKKLKKNQIPYTYSYCYFYEYMYRYTKYDNYTPSVKEVKQILGYSPENKTIDYISKDNGLLDSENILKTIYDFPILHSSEIGLEFTMLSQLNEKDDKTYSKDWRKSKGISRNRSAKFPVLGFFATVDDYDENIIDCEGTFYNCEHTTLIDFRVFSYCMAHEDLGSTGFYIYSYILSKRYHGYYDASIKRLSDELMLSITTVQKYINTLREYNLINTNQAEYFIVGATDNEKLLSNSHIANDPKDFVFEDEKKVDIKKPKFISVDTYNTYYKKDDNQNDGLSDDLIFEIDSTLNSLLG